jgi:hypothetical protein
VADPAAVREAVLAEHASTVERVLACAEAVADTYDSPPTDGRELARTLERALSAADVLPALPGVLVTAVDAVDGTLPASPVAAPPYVVVTSRGPVLRATLSDYRLVVTLCTFETERDPRRYVRGPSDPSAALSVAVRD